MPAVFPAYTLLMARDATPKLDNRPNNPWASVIQRMLETYYAVESSKQRLRETEHFLHTLVIRPDAVGSSGAIIPGDTV